MSRTQRYLEEAADRLMIMDLLARYVWAIDYGVAEEWAEVFTVDGVLLGGRHRYAGSRAGQADGVRK